MRTVARSLQVLRTMNVMPGPQSILDLHAETGISRPALYRIMETLAELGYVRPDSGGGSFHLTHLVQALSIGFNEECWIDEISRPILEELQAEVVWPTDLATYADGAMHLRQTTRKLSPWTIDRAAIGLRLPMFGSAAGLAYLAFCPPAEQRGIVASVMQSDAEKSLGEPAWVEDAVSRTRRLGYGERVGGLVPESSAIAVPIFDERGVRGCISITFITTVLLPAQAAGRYLKMLQDASSRISESLLARAP